MKILRRSKGKAVVISIESVDDFTQYILHSPSPVLVYFWADSNGLSRLLGSRLEEKIASRDGDLIMASVNIDWAGEVALEWNVVAVPLIIEFREGMSTRQLKGNSNDEELSSFIEQAANA